MNFSMSIEKLNTIIQHLEFETKQKLYIKELKSSTISELILKLNVPFLL